MTTLAGLMLQSLGLCLCKLSGVRQATGTLTRPSQAFQLAVQPGVCFLARNRKAASILFQFAEQKRPNVKLRDGGEDKSCWWVVLQPETCYLAWPAT